MVVQKLNGSKNQVENKAIEALRDSEDDSGNLHITYDYYISVIYLKNISNGIVLFYHYTF